MSTRQERATAAGGVPDLLTVEEAARHMRIGRTKAYAMTREFRAIGGRSGLPVVEFGHVLRVPRQALEAQIGAPLTGGAPAPASPRGPERRPQAGHQAGAGPAVAGTPRTSGPATAETVVGSEPGRTRRRRRPCPDQLDLFALDPSDPSTSTPTPPAVP